MKRFASCCAVVVVLGSMLTSSDRAKAQSGAAVDCRPALAAFESASPATRTAAATALVAQKCPSPPGEIFDALRAGTWSDRTPLDPEGRLELLIAATQADYVEAETLSVRLLENGRWPDGPEVTLLAGSQVITALGTGITPYQVRLMLDVYEQMPAEIVREAVIDALRGSKLPEALLPALDASFGSEEPLRNAAMRTFPTAEARDAALARLLRELPAGPARGWVERISAARPATPARK